MAQIRETDMVEINNRIYVMPGRQGIKDMQLVQICDKNGRPTRKVIVTDLMCSPSGAEA